MIIPIEVMCVTAGCPWENETARVEIPELTPGVVAWPELRCSACQNRLSRTWKSEPAVVPGAHARAYEEREAERDAAAMRDRAARLDAAARLINAVHDFERFETECAEAKIINHPPRERMIVTALEQLVEHGRSPEGNCLAGCVVDEPDNGVTAHGWPCPAELVAAAVLGIREPGTPS